MKITHMKVQCLYIKYGYLTWVFHIILLTPDDSKLSTGGIVAIVLCLLILSFLVVTLFVCLVLLRKSR